MGFRSVNNSAVNASAPPPAPDIKKSGAKSATQRPPVGRKTGNPPPSRPPKPPPAPARSEDDLSWHDAFIAFMRSFPHVTKACKELGVDRRMAYRHKAKYADFADAWDKARELGTAALEDRGHELALNGNPTMLIFMLKSLKPKVYGDSIRQLQGGLDGGPVAHKVDLSGMTTAELRAGLELLKKIAGKQADDSTDA